MRWRNVSFLNFSTLMSFSLFVFLYINSPKASGLIHVPGDFSTIQAAIDGASVGDVIFVHQGIYYENVVVNKSVSLIGENKMVTVIDGGGSNDTIRIVTDNVSIVNFTIRNCGEETHNSGVFVEASHCWIADNLIISNGFSGIYLNCSSETTIKNNIVRNNTYHGVTSFYSFSNSISNNTLKNNLIGISLYSSSKNNIFKNTLEENENGVHLFYSSNNTVLNNTITWNKHDGVVLDFSSNNNSLDGNIVTNNNASGFALGSVYLNVLRNNKLMNNRYGFNVFSTRPDLQDFLNDVDVSNEVDEKPVYYIVNQTNLEINSSSYPRVGYLALINCINVTVEDLNLIGNGQGCLVAFTKNSTFAQLNVSNNIVGFQLISSSNIVVRDSRIVNNSLDGVAIDCSIVNNISRNTIADNKRGIRGVHSANNNTITGNKIDRNEKGLWIFSYSINNLIVSNNITQNLLGICFERESHDNKVYHNNFINNTIQTEVALSMCVWDNGYPQGGNYWSDDDHDDFFSGPHQNITGNDGIVDMPYIIDPNNEDGYPLVNPWTGFIDRTPPVIGSHTRSPDDEILPGQKVLISVSVFDGESGVKNVTLFYTTNNGSSWFEISMGYNSSTLLYEAAIPSFLQGTCLKYRIAAYDTAGNLASDDNSGQYYVYEVVPEFSPLAIFTLFLLSTLFFIMMRVRKISQL